MKTHSCLHLVHLRMGKNVLLIVDFVSLLRIHKICSLESLSKLNILDLHDNQVLFLHYLPNYSICVFNLVHLVAHTVTGAHDFQLQSSAEVDYLVHLTQTVAN